ncbi:hypothetical protein D3C81_1944490 [compost metagenome]
MLHFHGFEYHQLCPGFDGLSRLHQHAHDAAVHRRGQPSVVAMAGFDCGNRVVLLDAVQFAFPLQVQAVAVADCAMLAAQAVMLHPQLFIDQFGMTPVSRGQGDGPILALTAQVQRGFGG